MSASEPEPIPPPGATPGGGRRPLKASLFTVFVTVFLDLLGFGLVVPYLPGVARELGASDLVAALVGASYSAMQLVFVPLWGALSDRFGRRPVLMVSIASTGLAMALLGIADSLWMIFAARVLAGIATANIAVAQAYIADVTPSEERSRGMALVGVAIGLGFVLGPVIGGGLSGLASSRPGVVPAFAAAGLSALNLLFATFLLPESLPAEKRGRDGEGSRRVISFESVRAALALPGVRGAVLVNLVVVASFAGLEQTFRLFTADRFHLGDRETGYVLGVSGIVLIVMQGGVLRVVARRWSERVLVATGLVIEAVGFTVLCFASPFVPLLFAGMSTISLGSAFVAPSLSTYVSRCGEAHNQGRVLGVLQSSGALARVVGPTIAGLSYQYAGPLAPYVSAAIGVSLAAGLASYVLVAAERSRGKTDDGLSRQ